MTYAPLPPRPHLLGFLIPRPPDSVLSTLPLGSRCCGWRWPPLYLCRFCTHRLEPLLGEAGGLRGLLKCSLLGEALSRFNSI